MGRIVSLTISVIYLIIAYIWDGSEMLFRILLFLILPLACIWFSEEMGSYTGLTGIDSPGITKESPPTLVKFMGWILLILPAITGIILKFW